MEIVVVGHLSRDLIVMPERSQEALGGGTAYAMLAPALGAFGAGIISKVGADFEDIYRSTLHDSGLDLSGLATEGPSSTRFVNEYDKFGNRTQYVESLAPPILPDDFSDDHLDATIIHFSPLTLHDVDIECIRLSKSSGALVSLDVQGFIRDIDSSKKVIPRIWEERDEVLGLVDVVKLHESELIDIIDAKSELAAASYILSLGPRIVLITHDHRGSIVYTRDSQVEIPLVMAKTQVDTTGCGDTYAIGFLLEYMRSADVKRAGLFAATCSSFNVETLGPYHMPSRFMVEDRMNKYMQA